MRVPFRDRIGRQRSRPRASQRRRGDVLILPGVLLVIAAVSFLAPWLPVKSPTLPSTEILKPPSLENWFGTDQLGRDVFSRTVWGGRYALRTSAIAVAIGTTFGVLCGVVSAYSTRIIENTILRVMDIILGFPALLLALLLLATFGNSFLTQAFVIGIAFVPIFTRIVNASSARIRSSGFVVAGVVAGVKTSRIIMRHILPGVIPEVLVVASSAFGWAILLSSTLSFLGLGAMPPTPDWGSDLSAGQSYLVNGWWISTAPGVMITLCILVVNLWGDALVRRRQLGSVIDPSHATAPPSASADAVPS